MPHSGPVYGGTGRPASLPGESPASQSGRLYGSYDAWIDRTTLSVGSDDEKAPALEFGQDLNGRQHIAPRPLLRPIVEETKTVLLGAVTRLIPIEQRTVR
jgi:hypothetical protein